MPMNNEERAEYAAHAADAYGLAKEGKADYDQPETVAQHCITDLLHLINFHFGDNVQATLERLECAKADFEAEHRDELEAQEA